MGRGFLSGIFWGGIVSLVALFVSNQTMERQSLSFPRPEAAAVEVPGGSEFNQARPETDPVVPGIDARPEGDSVAGVAVPNDAETEPPTMDTTVLEVPVPAPTLDAPESLGDAPDIADDVVEPELAPDAAVDTAAVEVLDAPEAPAPAPVPDTADVEMEAPVMPEDAPEVAAEVEAPAPVVQEQEERAPLIIIHDEPKDEEAEIAALPDDAAVAEPEAAPQVASQSEAPSEPQAPVVSEDAALPWLDRLREAQIDDAPTAPNLPDVASEPSLPPVGASPAAPVVQESDASAQVAAVEQAVEEALTAPEQSDAAEQDTASVSGGESLLQPVDSLTERAVETGTLPVVRRLGDSSADTNADEADGAASEEANADTEIDQAVSDGPALTIYATEFEAPTDLPLVSIVLVHQGDRTLGVEILDVLPPNISFAVEASQSNAGEIARAYRAAGREVVMIPALPQGAAPQDIEQALGANFELVPEAVAVMDVSGSSFQSDRDAVEQVVDVVAASGHGIITFPRGLNPAYQAAQRAGVPTGLIFRNLDGEAEDQDTIQRNLDRAAFRARQDEAVILVGSTGSTMLAALTEWVLGSRAASVVLAPISAALNG